MGVDYEVLGAVKFLVGDCRTTLRSLPDKSVQSCVTSPPYYWQRDYEVDGQIGLESTPSEYVAKMVEVFSHVKRVLSDDGTLWINIGDSYNNRVIARPSAHNGGLGHDNASISSTWAELARLGRARLSVSEDGLKEKDLIGIPWMVAFALRSDGWYLRRDVIWSKNYGKPESVRDRPSGGHEYVFLMSKSKQYFYDAEPLRSVTGGNGRSVWTIGPTGSTAHSAGFPDELPQRCILAGSRPGDTILDPFAGSGTVGRVAIENSRFFVGCELKPEYIDAARREIKAARYALEIMNPERETVAA